MRINAQTKIAAVLRENSHALEAIVSLSPKFTKLRNPFLRKVMASRTSIITASRLGGCSTEDFFSKLQPLGFEIDRSTTTAAASTAKQKKPEFLLTCPSYKIIELDVRDVIETGKDPFDIIMKRLKALESGLVLKIVNSFEPTPLIDFLAKKGYTSYSEDIDDNLVFTYFYQDAHASQTVARNEQPQKAGKATGSWTELLERFRGHLETINVRSLPMPLPMQRILEALENLPTGNALLVYHKRIPVFLLPELAERKLSYLVKEISATEVELLIYHE